MHFPLFHHADPLATEAVWRAVLFFQ
jgi:hypothetical protein